MVANRDFKYGIQNLSTYAVPCLRRNEQEELA